MTDHPTEAAVGPMNDLMRAVLENPFDDLPRLVLADYLDEHGDGNRAEFIRVQINKPIHELTLLDQLQEEVKDGAYWWAWPSNGSLDWHIELSLLNEFRASLPKPTGSETRVIYRRGFPSSVSLTLAALCGGPCDGARCDRGQIYVGQDNLKWIPCLKCKGTGRAPGCAALLSRWPVTAVTLVDARPWRANNSGMFCWWRASAWTERSDDSDGNLPDELFDMIQESHPDKVLNHLGPPSNHHIGFPSRESALTALSRAACDYVRSLAEPPLPALRWGK